VSRKKSYAFKAINNDWIKRGYEIEIDKIIITPRRPIKEEIVKSLTKSIQEEGLLDPILISEENVLIAGLHRLEAFKRLRKKSIPCTIITKTNSIKKGKKESYAFKTRDNEGVDREYGIERDYEIEIDKIIINERRPAREWGVLKMAKSIQEKGLLTPILISKNNILIAGLYRIEAFKLLRRKTIPCTIINEESPFKLKLMEIRSNIVRVDEGKYRKDIENKYKKTGFKKIEEKYAGMFENKWSRELQKYCRKLEIYGYINPTMVPNNDYLASKYKKYIDLSIETIKRINILYEQYPKMKREDYYGISELIEFINTITFNIN